MTFRNFKPPKATAGLVGNVMHKTKRGSFPAQGPFYIVVVNVKSHFARQNSVN